MLIPSFHLILYSMAHELPWWLSWYGICLQCSRPGFESWEDPLEKGWSTHSSIFAWEIQWAEETGGLQSIAL